ncbi:hypothetical protein ACTMU2_14510 [Cupriavidus basilensis]
MSRFHLLEHRRADVQSRTAHCYLLPMRAARLPHAAAFFSICEHPLYYVIKPIIRNQRTRFRSAATVTLPSVGLHCERSALVVTLCSAQAVNVQRGGKGTAGGTGAVQQLCSNWLSEDYVHGNGQILCRLAIK